MTKDGINRVAIKSATLFAFTALLMVLSGYLQPPQADEGTEAHIFQLSVVLLVPAGLLYLATADWQQPRQSARRLALPAVVLAAAFAALYYLEHYR
jgi:hypothetical protein